VRVSLVQHQAIDWFPPNVNAVLATHLYAGRTLGSLHFLPVVGDPQLSPTCGATGASGKAPKYRAIYPHHSTVSIMSRFISRCPGRMRTYRLE
jgi:hypothetical protein